MNLSIQLPEPLNTFIAVVFVFGFSILSIIVTWINLTKQKPMR